ncbi:hypothetical protein F5148DRAFT_1233163, partial [Russula earlei]
LPISWTRVMPIPLLNLTAFLAVPADGPARLSDARFYHAPRSMRNAHNSQHSDPRRARIRGIQRHCRRPTTLSSVLLIMYDPTGACHLQVG